MQPALQLSPLGTLVLAGFHGIGCIQFAVERFARQCAHQMSLQPFMQPGACPWHAVCYAYVASTSSDNMR